MTNHDPPHRVTIETIDSNFWLTHAPLAKSAFMDAYAAISRVEDILTEAGELLDKLPSAIQTAILNHHNDPATLQHCLRWGLQAAKEIREDWPAVVAGIPCGEVPT